jgi:hypothetical protein
LDEIRQQQDKLAALCAECFGEPTGFLIEAIEAGEGEKGSVEDRNGQMREMRREALNQPLLQTILDVFDGSEIREVVPREETTKA